MRNPTRLRAFIKSLAPLGIKVMGVAAGETLLRRGSTVVILPYCDDPDKRLVPRCDKRAVLAYFGHIQLLGVSPDSIYKFSRVRSFTLPC